MSLRVGLLYNLKSERPQEEEEPPDADAELDSVETISAITQALIWAGHEVIPIEADLEAYAKLRDTRIDVAMNIAEGTRGPSRESQIPAILDMLGIPYTGSGVLTLAVSLDKPVTKKLFQYHGVPTPRFVTVPQGKGIPNFDLNYPLFVKPAREGSSKGITPASRVNTELELVRQVEAIHRLYKQDALVEEFIEGREFTVGILGNDNPYMLPIGEICFNEVPEEHKGIYTHKFKTEWNGDKYFLCPAPISEETATLLYDVAYNAYCAVGCVDVARLDIRLSDEGKPYVLEINPLPGLCPRSSDLPRMAAAAGLSYNILINAILNYTLQRYGLSPSDHILTRTA